MRKREFGRTGEEVAVIGQGTWNMERDPREAAVCALRRGIDLGMTHIDTAEMYGSGRVEELVGEAIAGLRDQVFLSTKVLPSNASYDGTRRACEKSLARLKTDHLDLYMLHWPSSHALAGTVAAFEKLVEEGKIRFWGVSNFDAHVLDEAVRIAGEGRIASNQVLFHLGERHIERAVAPFCEEHGIAVVAYSPLGSGGFPSQRSAGGKVLADIAEAHGASPRAVALSFLTRHEGSFAIPKAANEAHVLENARAGDLVLADDESERIARAFPIRARAGLPTI
jgi:diketogulonate reductase-like aldo/keto reductase